MARGINMGNMLEAPLEGDWGPAFDPSWPALVKAAGFTTVRLPIRWSNHASVDASAVLDPTFLARVDFVLASLQASGLKVILDMHHYRQLDGDGLDVHEVGVDPSVVQARAISIWKQVAAHYANQPDSVIFGLYNEPHGIQDATGTAPWNKLYPKLLAQVRATNPTRVVIIGPAYWNNPSALATFTPSTDQNVITEIHDYEPYPFSSQGTYGTTYPLGTAFDAATMTLPFTAALDVALNWSKAHGFPMFVGEFGSNIAAPAASRVAYATMARTALESRSMPWTAWNFDSDFAVYDTTNKVWNTALLKALTP
jgi:endoglucanase